MFTLHCNNHFVQQNGMKEFKVVEWKGIHNDIFAVVKLTRETVSKELDSKYISTLTTSPNQWIQKNIPCIIPYHSIPYSVQAKM